MTKEEWLKSNGFSPITEDTECVIGDTFAIKDKLKQMGLIYSPVIGWHCAISVELPSGYSFTTIPFDLIYEWDGARGMAYYKEDAKENAQQIFSRIAGPDHSQYIGKIGDKITCNHAFYLSSRGYYDARQKYTYIHTFRNDDNILVWFTQSPLYFEKGASVSFSATVKGHQTYHGIQTTIIKQCRFKNLCKNIPF